MTQTDQHKIVILEKNQGRRDYLRSILSGRGYLPFIFEKETICLDNLLPLQTDLVISGPLSNDRMYRFVNTVKMMNGSMPVLIISDDPSINDYATSNGFGDIKVIKINFEPAEIKGAISKMLHNRLANKDTDEQENPLIIGNSPEILKIKKRMRGLNHFKEPVLIQGEPGTGKELVARAIHHQSEQNNCPFVKVQLGDINPASLDEMIFSVRKDGLQQLNPHASGAENQKSGGTLFLNEIATLSTAGQSRLLSIFEKGIFAPAAENRTTTDESDFAIVVSSSSLLDQLVKEGKFRKDLYYRMSVISLQIPSLRERASDIPLLTDFFTDKFCMEYGTGHFELSKKIKESFYRYPWPGNVRELKSIVHRAVLYGEKDSVIQNLTTQWFNNPGPVNYEEVIYNLAGFENIKKYLSSRSNLSLKDISNIFLMRTEKKIINKALEKTSWNRKKAARMLEISYKSLLNKIKEYQLA